MADRETLVNYVMRYGGRCRDCADENGTCPSSGLACEPDDARRAINHTLNAIEYGRKHGYLPPDAELSLLKEAATFHEHNWTMERDLKVAAIKHAKEAEARLARVVEVMRRVNPALSAAFQGGMEEREGGSANRQARYMESVDQLRADARAFLSEQENRDACA